MDVEFEDIFVHFGRFGKADGFALQPFEVSAKVQVFALDALGAVFSDMMAFGWQHFGVALPVVGVEVSHLARQKLLDELAATGIGAAAQDEDRNISGVTVKTIPKPHLLPFVLHI